ncbi:MAG: SMI1/KNR4 family protein [Christensenellales bacterium]
MYLDKLLSEYWKTDDITSEGKLFCHMPEINEQVYLHRLYSKVEVKYYEKFEQLLNCSLIPELKEFYQYYNGCRLFHSSINIFGFEVGDSKPMPMLLNNINQHRELENRKINGDDIIYFGNVGDYLMYYRQSEIDNPSIYLSKHGSIEIYKKFSSIKELLTFYIKLLSNEYKSNGYRKHPKQDSLYKKYPVIANSFNGDIDWEVPDDSLEKTFGNV